MHTHYGVSILNSSEVLAKAKVEKVKFKAIKVSDLDIVVHRSSLSLLVDLVECPLKI